MFSRPSSSPNVPVPTPSFPFPISVALATRSSSAWASPACFLTSSSSLNTTAYMLVMRGHVRSQMRTPKTLTFFTNPAFLTALKTV
jgi:hypothetical protein